MNEIGWGIIGCGNIARSFASDLTYAPGAKLAAVASRSGERAAAFARDFGNPRSYDHYEDIVMDKNVDVVYIATPHNYHLEHTLLCINHQKAVLCEKPLATNQNEVAQMIKAARKNQVFLMEAMWSRYLPAWRKVKEVVSAGTIGKVRLIRADFGFNSRHGADGRHLNPELAGGALLDVGIYPISFACWLMESIPEKISSTAHLTSTGVDGFSSYNLQFENNASAQLSSSVNTDTPKEALIIGASGSITMPTFWKAREFRLEVDGAQPQTIPCPFDGNGYQYEAIEVMRCLSNGQHESSEMTLNESQSIMRIMDTFRHEWGMQYPWENV